MLLTFLGTGGAWGLPELNCDCLICRQMRRKNEKRQRTALFLQNGKNLLIDCGPDIATQLSRHSIQKPDALLITHEHGDHYIGLDELFSYKRTAPKQHFEPVPVYLTAQSWQTIEPRFDYLADMGVIKINLVNPSIAFRFEEYEIIPFKTNHGAFAAGSVGYIIKTKNPQGQAVRLVYTSDFVDIADPIQELFQPDYLIIQSFFFNEPHDNHGHHMSFQKALDFIQRWQPQKQTFLVHLGDADMIPEDPANNMAKKKSAPHPLTCPRDGRPYPPPLDQVQWQERVNQIIRDYKLTFKITVARDDLVVKLE
jgi:phosphoribosyl 1,2-cyclic phosphate phosphodiesterase